MSGGRTCWCPARTERKLWEVVARNHNNSVFAGGRYASSAYSAIHCRGCGAIWRTRGVYVADLPNAAADWANFRDYKWQRVVHHAMTGGHSKAKS